MPLFKTVSPKLLPEGVQVLKITACDYDTDFGVIKLHLENEEGIKHIETYYTINSKTNEPNSGAINSFHYIAKVAMNNFDLGDFDTDELVGKFFRCDVGRREYTDRYGNPRSQASLGDKTVATGFDDDSSEIVDLDEFLDV